MRPCSDLRLKTLRDWSNESGNKWTNEVWKFTDTNPPFFLLLTFRIGFHGQMGWNFFFSIKLSEMTQYQLSLILQKLVSKNKHFSFTTRKKNTAYKKHFSSVLLSTLLATIGGPFDSNEGLHMLWAVRFLCSCMVCGHSAMILVPIGMFPVSEGGLGASRKEKLRINCQSSFVAKKMHSSKKK